VHDDLDLHHVFGHIVHEISQGISMKTEPSLAGTQLQDVGLEAFTAVMFQVEVFWVVML